MKPIVLFIVLILAFLCGDNVLTILGYLHRDFTSSAIFRIHPLTYLAILLVIYYFITGRLTIYDFVHDFKNEFVFLMVIIFILCYLGFTHNLNAISFLLDAICLPALLSILLKITNQHVLSGFKNWIYIFFFINAGIGILEKIIHQPLISKELLPDADYFRSTAIFGHPLNNGLIMSVLTVSLFFCTDKNWLKITVLFFGMLSIFCFGSRAALVGVFAGVFLNIIFSTFSSDRRNENSAGIGRGLTYLGVFLVFTGVIVNYTNLGDRIAALSHVDDSAETRIDSYAVLHGLDLKEVLWGFGTDQIEYLQYISGVEIIENFYIVWILKFGVVIAALLLIALVRFLYLLMKNTPAHLKLPLMCTLFFVASTNNSLSSNTLAISIFILTYYVFFESNRYPNLT